MRIRSNKGFTLIELLIVVAIIGIIAAIAIPGLLRARMSGNEASAIGSLRAINSSQAAYSSTCGNGFYASLLTQLGTPVTTDGVPFISPDLGSSDIVQKSGFEINLGPGAMADMAIDPGCNGIANTLLFASYWAEAHPTGIGSTGTRSFWTNTLGTLYVDPAGDPITDTVGNTAPAAPAIVLQ